ncbi:MAG: 2OG-Fe(II) oxygenase [Phormidesmis sp.]
MTFTEASALTQYAEAPAVKRLDLSESGMARLVTFGEGQRQRYLNNLPFPHLVIDNLFPEALLADVLHDVQRLEHPIAKNFYGAVKEHATPDLQAMGPTAQRFLLDLCSARFCQFLEALTGVEGVIPDPHFEGGGVHEISRGGFSKMRTDFNWNKRLRLDRRLSMLIYLNPDWEESWGGHLELWDSEMQGQFVKIPPVFNKTVIFSTTDHSYHGHPNPLEGPDGVSRRSLVLYYYSNGRPKEEVQFFQSAGTNYKARPGEIFLPPQQPGTKSGAKSVPVSAPRRKAQTLRQSVKKKLKKKLPKPLLEIYKAGKRSLRG